MTTTPASEPRNVTGAKLLAIDANDVPRYYRLTIVRDSDGAVMEDTTAPMLESELPAFKASVYAALNTLEQPHTLHVYPA